MGETLEVLGRDENGIRLRLRILHFDTTEQTKVEHPFLVLSCKIEIVEPLALPSLEFKLLPSRQKRFGHF